MFVHKHTFALGGFGKVPSQLPSKDKIHNHNTSAALWNKKLGCLKTLKTLLKYILTEGTDTSKKHYQN